MFKIHEFDRSRPPLPLVLERTVNKTKQNKKMCRHWISSPKNFINIWKNRSIHNKLYMRYWFINNIYIRVYDIILFRNAYRFVKL